MLHFFGRGERGKIKSDNNCHFLFKRLPFKNRKRIASIIYAESKKSAELSAITNIKELQEWFLEKFPKGLYKDSFNSFD